MSHTENSLCYELSRFAEVMIKSKAKLNCLQEDTDALLDSLGELEIILKNHLNHEKELKFRELGKRMKLKKREDSGTKRRSPERQRDTFIQEFRNRLNSLENSARISWLFTFMFSSNYLRVPQPPLRCDWSTPRKRSIPRVDVKL